MNYKDKCIELYERQLRDHFAEAHNTETIRKRADALFGSEGLSHLNGLDHAKDVNAFVSDLMMSIAKEVCTEHLESTVQLILIDARCILDGLISDEEAKLTYEFLSSDTGKKLMRNLDLFHESLFKNSLPMTTEIVARWCDPDTGDKIRVFIESLVDGDDDVS